MNGTCRLCGETKEVRHVNLFVFGSEGLWICHDDEMKLVEFARQMSVDVLDKKLEKAAELKGIVRRGIEE